MTDNFDFTLWTDTEKAARIEKLRQSKPIEITGNEVPYSEDLKQYRKNAFEYSKMLRGDYLNKDTQEQIQLTASKNNGGLREILHHDYLDIEHLQSISAIPQIIENSIFIDEINNDDTKRLNIKSFRYYAIGLNIGMIEYTVKSVISVTHDGSRYYDHKLTRIEKGRLIDLIQKLPDDSRRISSQPLSPSNLLREYKDKRLFSILQIKIPKSIGGVELSYEQRQLLTLGEAIKLYDITDKQGKKRNILVQWNTNANKLKISEIKAEHIVQKVAPSAALQKILDAPSISDNGEDSPQIKRNRHRL